ncbi:MULTISPECIES: hypothetical protein [Hyphomicrobiales]|uniref:hypothetical protein n=1 Tax=Hyphomicrobiales TaxID=356 RepID=UPI002119B9BC|nr:MULTISPECIES: hypothetical protein [Hyphomicrobiales]MCQ9147347.1 hypothetical protein [Ochrobactrum sp. BTU2]MDH1270335.1 hypothetical protein [Agrobacterium pusense]MDX4076703.1 hypothetical protein [Brucella sp. NBRC 113783]
MSRSTWTAGAALSILILTAFSATASADSGLSGIWRSEDDEFEINFKALSVDLGPDTGCSIKSLISDGSNRWRMRLSCGVADTSGGFQTDTTLQLKGSTLILTDEDGPIQLRRAGK